jgi:hypothetical protein
MCVRTHIILGRYFTYAAKHLIDSKHKEDFFIF